MTYLTFPQFQATRAEVDKLENFSLDSPGWVYDNGHCYIERHDDGPLLVIGNGQWSGDLAKLERILWANHYLAELSEEPLLSRDDGTLDDYVVGICDARGREVDGDLFGQLFSGAERFSISEADDIMDGGLTIQVYTLRMYIDVHDRNKLAAAARQIALRDMTAAQWQEMREESGDPIAADLQMILDPGVSPAGVTIRDCSATFMSKR